MSQLDDNELSSKPSFEEALEELKSDSDSLPSPALVLGLSGLSAEQMEMLHPVWKSLDGNYRRVLMQMLVDASEANFELDFQAIAYANLKAPLAEVRQAAIELIWEDESPACMRELIQILKNDVSALVRAEAAKSLGRFVFLGEMEEIDETDAKQLQKLLLSISNSDDELDVRRFAIESLGHCTSNAVTSAIEKAYHSDEPLMRLSALIAMGHTFDNRWEETVLEELDSHDEDMRRAAAHAAGEIQIAEAVPAIIRLLNDGDNDSRDTVIWSLGEIGGKEAVRVLENLMEAAEEAEDDALIDLIDEAIANASLADGSFMMFDVGDFDIDEEN